MKHSKVVIFLISIFACLISLRGYAFTVVIDAGHGGKDVGAVGVKNYEKNINLGVALKVGELIKKNLPDVKVVYTRDNDKYLTLQERANLANKAGGDLFISIHTNSLPKNSPARKSYCGASTYTLGLHRTQENLEVAKRENSVIELEDGYKENYRGFDPNSAESYIIFEINQSQHLSQSIDFASRVQEGLSEKAARQNLGVRQAGFWVLAATSMPAVLIELDFISHPQQELFLASETGQNKLADGIFSAFKEYKHAIDTRNAVAKGEEVKPKQQAKNNVKEKTVKEATVKTQSVEVSTPIEVKKSPKQKVAEKADADTVKNRQTDAVVYKVQILAVNKALADGSPELKKLEPVDFYREGIWYKYTYGATTSQSEALQILKKVKEKFPKAFIVKFKNGEKIK